MQAWDGKLPMWRKKGKVKRDFSRLPPEGHAKETDDAKIFEEGGRHL